MPLLKYHSPIDYVDTQLCKAQYIPTVKCWHCPDEVFVVIPYFGIGPIEEHLQGPSHAKQVRLRAIALSITISEALKIHGSTKAIAGGRINLASGQVSLSGFNEYYLANSGQPLLILAVKLGDINGLRHLLDQELSVARTDRSFRSALHWACKFGRLDMAELLMRHGASLYDFDTNFQTPFDLALSTKGIQVATLLINIEAAMQLEKSPRTALTTLALACHHGHPDVVKALVANGTNVNEGTFNCPLEVAIRCSSWRILEILLKAGANLQSIDHQELEKLASNGCLDYPDLQEKITLLKQYGLRL